MATSNAMYYKRLRKSVWRKFQTQERVEWWWTKFHKARRRRVWKLSEQQNHRCCYCSRLTWVYDNKINIDWKYLPDRMQGMSVNEMATADHFIPSSKGGTERIDNFIMACMRCNSLRLDMDAHAFWEMMQTPETVKRILRKQRASKRNRDRLPKNEKRQTKHDLFVMWLGYLFFVSPEIDSIFKDILRFVEAELAERDHQAKAKLAVYSDLLEAACRQWNGPASQMRDNPVACRFSCLPSHSPL